MSAVNPDARSRVLGWALFALVVAVVLAVTFPAAVGTLAELARVAPDRLPWVATRIIGFLGYFAIAGSVVYGLLLSTKVLDAIAHRPVSFALHKDLSAIGLGLSGVHAALLMLDSTVPFALGEVVVPFAAPYRPLWVGVGQVGLYLLGIVYASFYVRRRIGQRSWRALHYLTFLAFAGATAHGILAGTDTGTAWAWWSYVAASIAVIFLTVYRITLALEGRRAAASGTPRPAWPSPLDLRAPGG